MSKKWKTIVASAVLAAAVATSGTAAYTVGRNNTKPAYAAPVWSDSEVENVKPFGTKFTVPERTLTVNMDGGEYDLDKIVRFIEA